jgi:ferric-dicitrate binding protein FerR (iron transport regulator)
MELLKKLCLLLVFAALPVASVASIPFAVANTDAGADAGIDGSAVTVSPGAGISERNEERPLAIVRRFRPIVVVKHTSEAEWLEAKITQPLFDKDTLRTGPDGYALIQFMDNSLARVRPNSLLVIRGETRDRGSTFSRITLEAGELLLNVNGRQSNYEVQTRTAVASVKGTTFNTKIEDDLTTVFTGFSGVVEIIALNSGQTVTLTRRNRVRVDQRGETVTLETISSTELQNLQQQYDDLEEGTRPDILRLRFMNRSGQVREIDIRYFETD